jgi:hypothetical protein
MQSRAAAAATSAAVSASASASAAPPPPPPPPLPSQSESLSQLVRAVPSVSAAPVLGSRQSSQPGGGVTRLASQAPPGVAAAAAAEWRASLAIEDRMGARAKLREAYRRNAASLEELLELAAAAEEELLFSSAHSRLHYFKQVIDFDARLQVKRKQLAGSFGIAAADQRAAPAHAGAAGASVAAGASASHLAAATAPALPLAAPASSSSASSASSSATQSLGRSDDEAETRPGKRGAPPPSDALTGPHPPKRATSRNNGL